MDDMEAATKNAQSVRGGVVLVSLYSWTTITIIATIARFIKGSLRKMKFGLEDGLILIAAIIHMGAAVASHFSVNAGLGKHISALSGSDGILLIRAVYAASFLQIGAMACAKLSSAFLIHRVIPQTGLQRVILFGIVGSWGIFSLLTFGFQCGAVLPGMYTPDACGHGGPLFAVVSTNMISDIVLACWMFPTLRALNMDKGSRSTASMLFGARLVVPLVCIAQIWTITMVVHTQDPTWDIYPLILTTQAVASLSLIVTSIPRIKRFIGVAGSGMGWPVIDDTEIALANRERSLALRPGSMPLKLTPSCSGKFTTTVMSGKTAKDKPECEGEWYQFLSIGGKQNDHDHTSTSSLFDPQEGVLLQQEVTVQVEVNDTLEVKPRPGNAL